MRQITRTRGKHLGTHYIFNDYTEAIEWLTKMPSLNSNGQDLSKLDCFKHWMTDNIIEGDWITTDNGIVVQVLRIYKSYKKSGNTEYELIMIKTVGGLGYYMNYLSGTPYKRMTRKFCITEEGLSIATNMNSMKGEKGMSNARLKMKWVRLFVYYLVIYLSPVYAYKMMMSVKQPKTINSFRYSQFEKGAYSLLKNPQVIKELEGYMKVDSFRDRLSRSLKEQGINEKRIVDELSQGLDKVKKGTQTHKQFIELAMNISRYADEKENIGVDGKPLAKIDITETSNYELLPPPPKDIVNDVDAVTMEIREAKNDKVLDKMLDALNGTLGDYVDIEDVEKSDENNEN